MIWQRITESYLWIVEFFSRVKRARFMNLSDTEQKSTGGAVVSNPANTRLSGPWLIVARAMWLALVVPSVGLFVVSLPAYYQQLQRGCVDQLTCSISGALPVQVLHTIGISSSAYAALLTIFFVLIEATCYGVGFLLFWRRSDDWLALLAAFSLVMFNGGLALPSPVLILPISLVSFLGNASITVFFLLFPHGRLVPRWTALILLLVIIYEFLNYLPSKGSPFDGSNGGHRSLHRVTRHQLAHPIPRQHYFLE